MKGPEVGRRALGVRYDGWTRVFSFGGQTKLSIGLSDVRYESVAQ